MKTITSFDAKNHIYTINGRVCPSVTQVLKEVFGLTYWGATDWHRERGTAVHGVAAFVARGKSFKYDPQITGQVIACRKFFKDLKPEVLEVEQQLFSERYMFGGCPDLICKISGHKCVVDYKASITDMVFLQLGGYAILNPGVTHGMGVELRKDGSYKCTELAKIDRFKNEFLSVLTVFNIRKRLKIND